MENAPVVEAAAVEATIPTAPVPAKPKRQWWRGQDMTDYLLLVLKVAVSIATIGSLLELGLQLEFREALVGLRNRRFVALTLLWGFVLGPALAWLLARALSLSASSVKDVPSTRPPG